jgi:hypothetical protein
LTIHVIGALEDSELWKGHPDLKQESRVFAGYTDALAEIAENFRLRSIRLKFFGPECPKHNINKMLSVPPIRAAKSTTKLMIKTCNKDYRTDGDSLRHIIVFFKHWIYVSRLRLGTFPLVSQDKSNTIFGQDEYRNGSHGRFAIFA